MADSLLGKQINGYEFLTEVGRGGMATVYRAQQLSMMNRIVAIKVLPSHLSNDATYLQRFEREVEIVARLEHRSIVPVYDYGQIEGQPYIVMRYMPGGSVDEQLRAGPMTPEAALGIFQQIAPALDYAHTKDVLHRDLKPSNVLLDESGGAFLTDFGIARLLGETTTNITTQGVVGTPSYMSPEQAQGKPLDGRSDIYSLGVMLFEMVTGRRPFEADTPYGIAVAHVTEPPPSPRSIQPMVPPAVENVILTALSKQRDQRYANAAAMLEALQRALHRLDAVAGTDTLPTQAMPVDLLEATIPMRPTPPPAAPVMATPPDVLSYPTPTFTPQPLSPPIPPAEVYTGSAAGLRPVRRRAVGSLWMSALLGGVIGCALFVLLALVVLLAFSALNQVPATQTFPTVVTRVVAATRTASTEQPTLLMATNTPQPETPYVNPATPLIFDGLNLPTPDALTVGGVQAQGQIVFAAERLGNVDIYLIDVATRIETRLTDNPAIDTMPYPAPDGRSIVFSSNRDGDYEIYTMSIDGSGVTALTDNSFDDLMPSYSPNGTWIVFSADTDSDRYFDLYRMFPNGTSLERLFSSSERNADPRWISEDNAIYFSSGDPADASTWEIRRLDLNTGTHQWLIENTRRDRSPTQGSDGALLFETDGDGRSAIASLNAAGGETAIIYDGPGFDSQPNLSPDGRLIVFNSDVEGRDQLYLMTARGEDVQRLTTLGGFGGVWVPPI